MAKASRAVVAPLYLLGCLVLGASAEGAIPNLILQISGLAILAWSAAVPLEGPMPPRGRHLLAIAILAVAFVALQNVPLPTMFWPEGIRSRIADDMRLLGKPASFVTVSVTPYQSLTSLLAIIPPLAMFCALVHSGACRLSWLISALAAGTLSVTVLSTLQIGGGSAQAADLVLVTFAFALAAATTGQRRDAESDFVRILAVIAIIILLIIALALAHSAAGYALAPSVFFAGLLSFDRVPIQWRRIIVGLGALALVGGVATLLLSPVPGSGKGDGTIHPIQSRREVLVTENRAIREFMPWGSGLGSFASVYPVFERADAVTSPSVMHGYNDYAEVALELGLPGVALLVAFLVWWAAAVTQIWERRTGAAFSRAAAIGSATVLIHSLVDFPLRTSAISVSFAMCLALLVNSRTHSTAISQELRSTRHIVIG